MKSGLAIVVLLCSTLLVFGQRHGKVTDTGSKWINVWIYMNNNTARTLDLDTTLVAGGFTDLNVVAIPDNTDNFKFERDKFNIQVINDFVLNGSVKESFVGRTSGFTLYIYTGKMIIYKKKYSIMFDGSRNPKVLML